MRNGNMCFLPYNVNMTTDQIAPPINNSAEALLLADFLAPVMALLLIFALALGFIPGLVPQLTVSPLAPSPSACERIEHSSAAMVYGDSELQLEMLNAAAECHRIEQ